MPLRTLRLLIAALALGVSGWTGCGGGSAPAPGAAPDPAVSGPFAYEMLSFDALFDTARGRAVPTNVYLPAGTEASAVLVLSHGAGGTRMSYRYLAEHLASHGFVVLVPAHVGSDLDRVLFLRDDLGISLGAATLQVTQDPTEYVSRAADVSFLLDEATSWTATHETLSGRLDLDQVGVVGHSYGAFTALVSGGVLAGLPGGLASLADARVDAFVALSPQGPGSTGQFEPASFDTVAVPALLMAGTLDTGAQGQPASWRKEGYDYMPPGNRFFAFLEDAEHLHFAHGLGSQANLQTRHIVAALSVVFFDTFVRGDARYASLLTETYADALTGPAIPDVSWSQK